MRQNSGGRAPGQAPPIASRANPRVREIRGLLTRKQRERSGRFFIEGVHLVAAAAQLGAEIELLVVAPELLCSPLGRATAAALRERGVACLEVTAGVFETLVSRGEGQGIGAVLPQRWEQLARLAPERGDCWVALDAVQYPGNLGAILRTCDAVGGAGVILLGTTTDPYDPAALRASMGAIFGQRLVRASPAEFAGWTRRHGCMVVGTSPAATTDYQAIAYRRPLVLLMGSEPRGLAREHQQLCDVMVTIPMVGHADSLNLSVATSIVLYEIFNQGRVEGGGYANRLG